jgi:hypothetical protein
MIRGSHVYVSRANRWAVENAIATMKAAESHAPGLVSPTLVAQLYALAIKMGIPIGEATP